jgi:predicted outer membrane repeat protein
VYSVVSGADSGPGSLRYAIENAVANGTILVEVETINLESRLEIGKNLTILGNGVTLTRSAAWNTVSETSQLLGIYNSSASITVNISRVHFKNGRATNFGAAIRNVGETVNLESCIFSGNQSSSSYAFGGAIYNNGTMGVKGCTFYNNRSPYRGGAIFSSGTLTLTGNLFYGNTAPDRGPVVFRNGGIVTSNGYNVVDVALGTGTAQSGWASATGDKTSSAGSWPVSPVSFRLSTGSEAGGVITTLPSNYPAADFYGAAIGNGAAAGAVQGVASGFGYILNLSVNESTRGSVSADPAPDADGYVPGTVTLTASPAEGYELVNWLVNGTAAGSTNPLSLTISGNTTVQAAFGRVVPVTDFSDASGSATTPGTLRHALTNAQEWDIIRFTGVTAGATTIELGSALPTVSKNVTIEGNGVTLTRSAAWTATSDSSRLLSIYNSSAAITVNISRVHFKNGRVTDYGAAVSNSGETVNLESCIFSGNQTSGNYAYGGAIYNQGTMSVKGCTFYNNSSAYVGGAISNISGGTLTLMGNLFYGNTAQYGPVVDSYNSTVTSNGYNVVDVDLGTGDAQSGWASATGDTTVNNMLITSLSFKLLNNSEAANVITTLPEGYPQTDFYGDTLADGAAAGAVQSAASNSGYYLELGVNYSERGSISAAPTPNAGSHVSAGTVTITASPAAGYLLAYWLVDGVKNTSPGPLNLTVSNHTAVQAVFGIQVSIFTDTADSATTPGTLRYALTNAQDEETIGFTGVTPLTTAIELSSALPQVSKSVTIQGNGITLTRSAAWNTVSDTSQLLYIYNDSADITVNISQVYFKNGRATTYGAAIRNEGETVNLESCIFSMNQTTASGARGGVIYNSGTMAVKGSTFYQNISGGYGGAIHNEPGTLTLTGNLFYGNTATTYPVVYLAGGTVTSNGYNVANVDLGTGTDQSGWSAETGDQTFTGVPLTAATFAPVAGLNSVIPSAPQGFPAADFNGAARTWPGAPGAVK